MSAEGVRGFFAVELPGEVRAGVAAAVEALRRAAPADVRWTPVENLHLTLKFLGQVPERRIQELGRLAASRLQRLQPFRVGFAGYGAFPSARAARVLWLGVSEGAAPLARVARKLDAVAGKIGVARERRPYRAHLTLGRLPRPERVALEGVEAPGIAAFDVEEVVLFQSRLGPAGATYVPLARIRAGATDSGETDFAPEI